MRIVLSLVALALRWYHVRHHITNQEKRLTIWETV